MVYIGKKSKAHTILSIYSHASRFTYDTCIEVRREPSNESGRGFALVPRPLFLIILNTEGLGGLGTRLGFAVRKIKDGGIQPKE